MYITKNNISEELFVYSNDKALVTNATIAMNEADPNHPSFELYTVNPEDGPQVKAKHIATLQRPFGSDKLEWIYL